MEAIWTDPSSQGWRPYHLRCSYQEFDELCFEFGIELDDVEVMRKEKHVDEEASADKEIFYKIDVPANRYDLLCLEGLAKSLRIFTLKDPIPTYSLSDIPKSSLQRMVVKPETSTIRPHIVCAVLRGVTFDEACYNSFIDLQDKLNQNLCRRRTLVAIGTHDLDTLEGPFTYETKEFNGRRADGILQDMKLKKFLHILEGSPVYPVIYDSKSCSISHKHSSYEFCLFVGSSSVSSLSSISITPSI